MKRRGRKKIRAMLLYLAVILVLTLIAWGYRWIEERLQHSLATFELTNIDIRGNDLLSRQEVLVLCGLESAEQKLLTVKPAAVVEKLKASPYIKAAGVVRSLPATLRIRIVERRPVAFVYGRGLNLIDAEGLLMPVPKSNKNWNLPFISGIREPLGILGEVSQSENVLQAARILAFAHETTPVAYHAISELQFMNRHQVKLNLVMGGTEVRMLRQNLKHNLYILDQFLQHHLDWQQLPKIQYIDLRFKDQLIMKEKETRA